MKIRTDFVTNSSTVAKATADADGNVITVEPGLYFEKFGIGVRIEDDVLIKNGKGENLSANIKKEIEDIEKLFRTRGF